MRTGRRKLAWSAAVILAVVGIFVILRAVSLRASLLAQAHKVTLPPLAGPPDPRFPGTVVWLTPQRFIARFKDDTGLYDLSAATVIPMDDYVRALPFAQAQRFEERYTALAQAQQNDESLAFDCYFAQSGVRALPDPAMASLLHHLPSGARVKALSHSRDGKRLAWLLWRHTQPAWETYLHRVVPFYKPHRQDTLTLCVSAPNGSGLYEIGALWVTGDPGSRAQKVLSANYSLTWLPDNRHLSFSDEATLYTVSVD